MTPRELVLALARATAPDPVVHVPREWLLPALGEADPMEPSVPMKDLDAHALAVHFDRSVKTIRAWLAAGVFPQAYRTPAGWRVPRGALRHVQPKERKRPQGSGESRAASSGNRIGIRGQR